MFDRFEPLLRIICLALAALLLCQIVRLVVRGDPLGHASIPALPTLSLKATPATNSPAAPPTNAPAPSKMNGPVRIKPPKQSDLPAVVQARVDRIKESEILAPFMRPMPLALLGIAGEDAFLRAPDGQSGMVKEGGKLGGIKLLRIGTNRVVVEEDGEKKELTVFSGMGSDSLLPPEKVSSTNTAIVPKHKETP